MPQKTTRTHQNAVTNPQKILTVSGLAVILLAIITTIFTFMTIHLYAYDALSIIYYGRYVVTILGGFGIGLLFARLSLRQQHGNKIKRSIAPIYTGVYFGLLTFSLDNLLDLARLPMRALFGDPTYPWGRIIFEGLPLGALILVTLLASFMLIKGSIVSASHHWLQWIFVIIFVVQQISIISTAGFISSYTDLSPMTLLIGLLALIITPFFVSIVAFFILGNFKERVARIFTAAIIGVLYEAIMYLSWEFRTNAEYQAALVFSIIVTILTYVAAAALILFTRRAIHKKK